MVKAAAPNVGRSTSHRPRHEHPDHPAGAAAGVPSRRREPSRTAGPLEQRGQGTRFRCAALNMCIVLVGSAGSGNVTEQEFLDAAAMIETVVDQVLDVRPPQRVTSRQPGRRPVLCRRRRPPPSRRPVSTEPAHVVGTRLGRRAPHPIRPRCKVRERRVDDDLPPIRQR